MSRIIALLCIVFMLFSMCKKQTGTDNTLDFSLLNGRNYILNVDRVSQAPDGQFPRDSLDETYYSTTVEDIQFDVTFLENGQMASIKPGPVIGEKTNDGKVSTFY